ncbi:MAG: flagellar hook-basal body complex protein, partial [Rhodospirillaceae bacterium]|nr:flagellar hook-basal body complex protein [Rhodospirillales bacterium]
MGRLDFQGLPVTTGALEMSINGTDYTFNTNGTADDGATADVFHTDPSAVSTGTFVGNLAADINTAFNIEYNSLGVTVGGVAANSVLSIYLNGDTAPTNYTILGATADTDATAEALNTLFSTAGNGLKAVNNGGDVVIYSEDQMTFQINTAGSTPVGSFGTVASWHNGSGTASVTTMTTNGITYAEQLAGTNSLVFRQYDTADDVVVSGLSTLELTNGNPATMQGQDLTLPDTFTLSAAPDSIESAIVFNGDGTPKTINVGFIDVDWANGSTDMSGSDTIGLFLGNTGIRDGMTQLNGDYQLAYWNQNGAKFGNFAGVSVGSDGIVTALFDNGVTRPVFQIPVSTFVNPNGMQSLTGNVFISTDYSGEPTLRQA